MKTTGKVKSKVYSVLRSNKSLKGGLINLKLMSESSLRKSIGSHIIGELSSHPRSKLVDC
jgi:hypothetical protein